MSRVLTLQGLTRATLARCPELSVPPPLTCFDTAVLDLAALQAAASTSHHAVRRLAAHGEVARATLEEVLAALVARLLLARLQPDLAGVGGPVTGADPITGATVALSHLAGRPLMGFMVRKEPKGHGLKLWVEGRGNLQDGDKVCIVEDTVTTGGSLLRAIEHVEASGLVVAQVVVVVDRWWWRRR